MTVNGILDCGTKVLSGTGAFTLSSAATLKSGISSGINGNITVSGTKTLSTTANYEYNGSVAQVTGALLPATLNNFTINNSSGVTLSGNSIVNGALALTSGNLTTSTNTLSISSSGSVSRTSGHVIGNFQKNVATGATSKTFEVGTTNGYSPVTVTFGSVSVAGDLTTVATQSTQPNVVTANETLNRYWSFTNTGITYDNYSATFSYLSADFNGSPFVEATDEATMVVGQYSASTWSFPTIGTRDAAGNTIQVTGVTSFSDFAIGKNAAALPVELTSFKSNVLGKAVNLTWKTATEVNNYGFEVERATVGGISFAKVSFVKGSGNSNSPKEYSFTDNDLQQGKYQYRLKMLDNDGTFEYSKIVEAEIIAPKEFALSQNYPNPFNPVTTINYSLPIDSKVMLVVYSINGEKVAELINEMQTAGSYNIPFNANGLASGTYFYRLQAGEFVQTKKMIILK